MHSLLYDLGHLADSCCNLARRLFALSAFVTCILSDCRVDSILPALLPWCSQASLESGIWSLGIVLAPRLVLLADAAQCAEYPALILWFMASAGIRVIFGSETSVVKCSCPIAQGKCCREGVSSAMLSELAIAW